MAFQGRLGGTPGTVEEALAGLLRYILPPPIFSAGAKLTGGLVSRTARNGSRTQRRMPRFNSRRLSRCVPAPSEGEGESESEVG